MYNFVLSKMFSINNKGIFSKAFTLIELVLVLGIIAILVGFGFSAFILLRNTTIAGNTLEGAKTIIQDAQDKALTVAVDNDINLYYDNSSFDSAKPQWTYGYSIEYKASNKRYELYKIVQSGINNFPLTSTNTIALRAAWKTNSCVNNPNPTLSIKCVLEKTYPMEANIVSNTCNILFTSVNAIPSITANAASCYIRVDQGTIKMRLDFIKPSAADVPTIGVIRICSDNGATCP